MINFFKRIQRLTPLEGYNKWAGTYHVEDNPIKKLSDEFIKSELPHLQGMSVLDAGCGTGVFCKTAIDQKAAFVKGMDLSPKMIEQAKKNCPEAEFECADLSVKEIKEKYDVVICGLVLAHIDSLELALTNLVNALKPEGHIILTDFHPVQTMKKAKRTFSHHGKTFEISHTLHQLNEYFELFKRSGINVISIKEPEFNSQPVIFGIHGVAS